MCASLAEIEIQVPNASVSPIGANGARAFVAFAALLITIVYAMPIDHSWTRSLDDNYGADIATLEMGAREGFWERQVALALLGLFGLCAAAWPGERRLRVHDLLGILCVAYIVWCAASCFWATDFSLSLRRLVGAICEASAGFAIAKRTSARQFAWVVLICTSCWLALGLLAEVSLGTFRPWVTDNRFAGIFHPNDMGFVCALLVLSSSYLARGAQRNQWLLWVLAAGGLVVLYLTRSRTAVGSTILAGAATWLILAPARRALAGLLAAVSIAAILAILIDGKSLDLTEATALGRDEGDVSSLTGRVPLWEELLPYAAKRPWLGYGYNCFWTADHIVELSGSESGSVSSSHSLYLDLVLGVGLIGAALCLSAMLLAAAHAAQLERRLSMAGYGFVATIVIYMLASGVSETTLGMTGFPRFFAVCGICFIAFRDDAAYPFAPACADVRRAAEPFVCDRLLTN